MKIAIVGANGWIGSAIAREALKRGHSVTAIVRDPARLSLKNDRLTVKTGDATKADDIAAVARGHDVVVAALSGRRDGTPQTIPTGARTLLNALPQAGVKRLLWVGGAGSLEVAPGVHAIDSLPDEWKPESSAQWEALKVFRASDSKVDWTYLSPAAIIEPGERTGHYRTGGDQLVTNEAGESRISVDDYAVALLDEVERPTHSRQRFTVAY